MSEFDPEAQVVTPEETPSEASEEAPSAMAGAAEEGGPSIATPARIAPEATSPVAAALAELDSLGERDLAEHPDAYQRIHGELQRALSAIDDA